MRKERLVLEKNKIDGAFILIEEMKKQFKRFDKALEKMHKEKASFLDFEYLKQSVDPSSAKAIFNDMKLLFDATLEDFKRD